MKRDQPRVHWWRLNVGLGAERRRRQRLVIGMGIVTSLVVAIGLSVDPPSSGTKSDDAKPPAPESPHSREGAQQAASRIASAMGSERMFSTRTRHDLLQAVADPSRQADMIRDYDAAYAPFTARLGLNAEGRPPAGAKFVSRAAPTGTVVRSYTGRTAEVAVWCSTLFGLTGETVPEEIPVESGWLTMTVDLRWTGGQWRMTDVEQTDGPRPEDPAADQFDSAPSL